MSDHFPTPWIKGEREAAAYCRMSLPTWKRFRRLHQPRRVKLPGGSTLYRAEWLDGVLLQFAQNPAEQVERIVDEVMKDFQ